MSVSSDTTCTNAGTAPSDFLLDFMSECGDCNKIESMSLNEKAQLCSRLKESLRFVQKSSLEQEKEEATKRAHELFNKCDVCKLISDSRQRKQAEIRQLYLQVLDKKSAELLCTPGIFSRLETMASKGLFDAVVAEGQRCSKCRQATDSSSVRTHITSEVVEILSELLKSTEIEHCCVDRACSKCLRFVVTSLGHQEENTEINEEITKSTTIKIGYGQDLHYLKEIAENIKLFSETISKDQLKSTLECHMKNLLTQHLENLSCTPDICQKLDLLKNEIKNSNSSPTLVDENIKIPLNLPSFSGEAWESPRLAIRMWQENLRKSGTVKEEWCGLVCGALEGKAKDWCTEQDLTDVTWEQFTRLFLAHFDQDMKSVVDEYIKSVLTNDEGELITENGNRFYRKSKSNGHIFHRNYSRGKFFDFNWMEYSDIERFLLACLRALNDNLKHLLSLFNAQFSVINHHNTKIRNMFEPKVNPVTTFTELIMVLQKRELDNFNVDSIKYYKEMKSVAKTVMENTCSTSFRLDQLNF